MTDTRFIQTSTPAPLPALHDWVQFKRLPKWGWEMITLCACVLGYSTDRSRVQVGYLVGGQTFTHFIDRDQITFVYERAAETALLSEAVPA